MVWVCNMSRKQKNIGAGYDSLLKSKVRDFPSSADETTRAKFTRWVCRWLARCCWWLIQDLKKRRNEIMFCFHRLFVRERRDGKSTIFVRFIRKEGEGRQRGCREYCWSEILNRNEEISSMEKEEVNASTFRCAHLVSHPPTHTHTHKHRGRKIIFESQCTSLLDIHTLEIATQNNFNARMRWEGRPSLSFVFSFFSLTSVGKRKEKKWRSE